jgi:hypothetical protein
MDQREERITLETSRYRITGILNLPRDGYRSRLTDYLNASERSFLALTDVAIVPLEEDADPWHRPFITIAIRHIVFAMPAVDDAG